MALLSKPGLIPLKIENSGRLITTQVNKINFSGSVSASVGNFNDVVITVGVPATASWAISASQAISSSYSYNALSSSYALSASNALSSSFALTASYAANAASFPYSGSAQITGSLGISGSFSQSGSSNIILQGLINQTTAQSHVVTFNNTTGQLYITASSAFGGGGGAGTPGGANTTIQFNDAGVLSGSGNFTLVGANSVNLTGSLLVTGSTRLIGNITGSSFTGSFTGSLLGTASFATTASFALSAKAFPYSGSAEITGSLGVTGSIIQVHPSTQTSASQEYIDMNLGLGTVAVFNKSFVTPMSVFIEYFIIDTISGADQRAGTIMASFNNTGTPTEVFTETTTTDIGNTTAITFAAVSTPNFEIQATNTGTNSYQFRATLRYY